MEHLQTGNSLDCTVRLNIIHKVPNPYATDKRDFLFFSDPPHLIKTTRNCWPSKCRDLWVSPHLMHHAISQFICYCCYSAMENEFPGVTFTSCIIVTVRIALFSVRSRKPFQLPYQSASDFQLRCNYDFVLWIPPIVYCRVYHFLQKLQDEFLPYLDRWKRWSSTFWV